MSVELEESVYDKLIGQVLANRYLIETRLGEGAMGAVYRAKHVKVGRAFAVKVLHARLLEDKKVLQRFEREAELAGRLRHPNVIGVVDVGEMPDGTRYMVMDFAEGPDLATLLSEAPFPPQRVMTLTRQMLEGLYHAHEAGLIHRDFKPENVIVERDSHKAEVPRIVDFGIAILREGGESSDSPGRLTTNGLVLGTPHYMAPEQAVADPIDHRIDLFALGIMVYEMLCGKLPFDGSGAEVARANLLLDPPLISERVPYLEVDPLLEAFARRLMAKKRDLRPATAKVARELLDLIDKDREAAAAALGVPIASARAPMTTQPSAPVRDQRNHEGTFPPPLRSEAETPQLAPSLKKVIATPVGARSREHRISTEPTDPVKKSRAPMIGAAIVALGILGGAAAVTLLGGKKDNKPTTQQVATNTTPDDVKQPDKQAEVKQPDVGSAVEVKAPETGSAAIVKTPEAGSATETKTETKTEIKTTPKSGTATVKKGQTGTKTTTQKTGTQTTDTQAVGSQTKVETVVTPPPEVKTPLDANAIAKQYQSVGAALKSLEQAKGTEAVSDLWSRYRLIRITDAMSTQPKRDEAASLLSKLSTEIAARKK
ncbi:MAG TPA: serine/threonine-protein kinase [Kofleriaceae bacterium]|nr:serine/threonine-protein kinase [Kofleriaceae bacterium]